VADEWKGTVAEVSDRWGVGAAYDAYMGRWSRRLASVFVEWLGAPPRGHWLDVGCGTGALTDAICEHGAPASVVACDPSGPFLEAASSTLPDKRVAFELGDADHLPEREAGYDAIVSGLVLNFVPDAERALAAMRRRLSPSGLLAAYVWDYTAGVQFIQHFWDAAVSLDPHAARLDERHRFARFDGAWLSSAFHALGLERVESARLSLPTPFASFTDYWEPFLGRTGPAPSYVASLDVAGRERLAARLRERLPIAEDGGIRLEASAWAVRGRCAESA